MTTRLRLLGLLMALAAAIGACSGRNASSERSADEVHDATAALDSGGEVANESLAATADGAAAGAGGAQAAPVAPGQVPRLQQKVIKNAELRLKVKADGFREAFSRVVSIAESNGGFVADSQTYGGDGAASGNLTIRVPAERFDAARTALADLGELEHENISGQDVTAQLTDLDARLRNLRAQEEALRTLMGKAVNVGETMQVQQQLFGIREQIEQLAAQQAQLTDSVALATVRVSLFEPGGSLRADDPDPTSLGKALERAWHGAVTVVGALVIGLGYVIPLALLATLGWLVWRRSRPTAGSPAAS